MCQDLGKRELSHPGSFYERVPTKSQLRNDGANSLGHILGKCPLDHPPVVSECFVLNSLRALPETKSEWVYAVQGMTR
jgi:hypothetical protein